MESITEPKEQQQGGSTISASMAEQNVVGDGVPATAVVKMSNQLWIKYHSIETKWNQPKPRTEMHRGALAAANHARRRCCRPRGRRRCNSSSRRRQAELVGQLDAQGVSEAETSLAATVEHNNDGAGSPEMSKASGKTKQGERAKTTAAQAIKGGQEARGSYAVAFTAPARCQNGHDRA